MFHYVESKLISIHMMGELLTLTHKGTFINYMAHTIVYTSPLVQVSNLNSYGLWESMRSILYSTQPTAKRTENIIACINGDKDIQHGVFFNLDHSYELKLPKFVYLDIHFVTSGRFETKPPRYTVTCTSSTSRR